MDTWVCVMAQTNWSTRPVATLRPSTYLPVPAAACRSSALASRSSPRPRNGPPPTASCPRAKESVASSAASLSACRRWKGDPPQPARAVPQRVSWGRRSPCLRGLRRALPPPAWAPPTRALKRRCRPTYLCLSIS